MMVTKMHACTCNGADYPKGEPHQVRRRDTARTASLHAPLIPVRPRAEGRAQRKKQTKKQKTFQHAATQKTYGRPTSGVARSKPGAAYPGPHLKEIRTRIIHDRHDKQKTKHIKSESPRYEQPERTRESRAKSP
eukprot:jgi/Botrbrau1/15248/Bobra.0228s0001.1